MYKKIAVFTLALIILFIAATVGFYLWALPFIVKNDRVIDFVKKEATKNFNVDIEIKSPVLKTHLSSDIEFGVGNILVTKDGVRLVDIENLDSAISISKIFNKKIILKRLVFDNVFIDAHKLAELIPKEPQKPLKTDWSVQFLPDTKISLKNMLIVYSPNKEVDVKITGKNIALNIENEKFILDSFVADINKSRVFINSDFDRKGNFNLILNSKNFSAADAVKLMLLFPEAHEPLSYFSNVRGSFDFNIIVENDNINGKLNFKTLKLNMPLIANLPVTATQGRVIIDNKQILLKDFKGYYGKSSENKASMEGQVRDYLKSVDTKIVIKGTATNELTRDYISKLANMKIELVGNMPTRLTIKSINNIIDMHWNFRVKKGKDVLLEGHSFTPTEYDRMLRADFHLENNLFTIKKLDYYIAETLKRGMKIEPIISITGNMDARNASIKDMGFSITKPLPSEFLNLFTREKTFKRGTVAGHLKYIDPGNGAPFIDGRLEMEGVRLPGQKLSIKKGVLSTDRDSILLSADGRFRRTNYHFNGNIANKVVLPIVAKDVNLEIENIDIERVLKSLNQEQPQQETEEEGVIVFKPNLVVIEKCRFRVDKGVYKTIEFGNINADLTLDKDGNLKIQSNWFDFAKGISTLRVACDLVNQKYYIRLGAKNFDVDLVATSILALEKEITGKASALLELNTDRTFKLNGLIRFTVEDGTITKLGLVQYVLNAAAIFRNPTLISPSTILDLVNIPEGNFKLIDGELHIKDNIARRMKIKSLSPHLSSFIAGRMNLETGDMSLRIYTKFSNKNKGISGLLRNISLNSIARKFDVVSNANENYYAAEIAQLPEIEAKEEDSQIFLTKVEGDVQNNNFISSLKKIK